MNQNNKNSKKMGQEKQMENGAREAIIDIIINNSFHFYRTLFALIIQHEVKELIFDESK
tara:strand:+ start:1012 stop:1188 length:177 start_codon:yes stop_codon:yes gene_type:complete